VEKSSCGTGFQPVLSIKLEFCTLARCQCHREQSLVEKSSCGTGFQPVLSIKLEFCPLARCQCHREQSLVEKSSCGTGFQPVLFNQIRVLHTGKMPVPQISVPPERLLNTSKQDAYTTRQKYTP